MSARSADTVVSAAAGERNLLFASALVRTLAANGVRRFVVSPGSRCTPLTVAVVQADGVIVHRCLDERGAAFMAQGAAKASGEPVVLICTSGTAAANYLPGIIEASESGIPLIVLTADRPPELRGCGSPQTIDQIKLYGSNVRAFHEAPVPDSLDRPGEAAAVLAARAVVEARSLRGPVHLNLPFREPLIPEKLSPENLAVGTAAVMVPKVHTAVRAPEPGLVRELAREIRADERGWIVAGPQAEDSAVAIAALSWVTGYPVLADAASGLRFGELSRENGILAYHDGWLRDPETAASVKPRIVIRFGAAPTSKTLSKFLASSGAKQIVVDGAARWVHPENLVARIVDSDPVPFCEALVRELGETLAGQASRTGWKNLHAQYDRLAEACVDEVLEDSGEPGELGEIGTVRTLVDGLPAGSNLFVSNSMPVRDLDWFGGKRGGLLRVQVNRGANGIDGILSSALGMAAASNGPSYLLTGDLAFLHDINALSAAAVNGIPLTVIAVNNDGGGIFHHLPVSGRGGLFTDYFQTPQPVDLIRVAAGFGVESCRAKSADELRGILEARPVGIRFVEVAVDPVSSLAVHRRIWERMALKLADAREPRRAVAS